MISHPMVLPGKEGWLFLTGDSNRVIDQISGKYPIPESFYADWRDVFVSRMSRAQGNYEYHFAIVPNKECVYAHFLPEEVRFSENRPVAQVMAAAHGVVNASYLLDPLINMAKSKEVFIKGDTHWNHIGALVSFNELMKSLGMESISESDIECEDVVIEGDLTGKIGQSTVTTTVKLKQTSHQLIDNNKVSNVGQRRVYENTDKSLPTAVLFRDSFASHQLDMFAARFSRIVCIWQPNLDFDIIEREKPDFVISQQVERFLVSVPNDITDPSHEERERLKMAEAQ